MRPLRGLQETRVATREESGVLGFPSRRGLTPRGSLECNPVQRKKGRGDLRDVGEKGHGSHRRGPGPQELHLMRQKEQNVPHGAEQP